jgi:hypothetical protein
VQEQRPVIEEVGQVVKQVAGQQHLAGLQDRWRLFLFLIWKSEGNNLYDEKLNFFCTVLDPVLRIHDILVWIRIWGSMPLTNGSGYCY